MTVSKESKEFFVKLSKIWQNFKDYTYLEGINLSSEQISIIEQDEDQLLIEGYAGTGKSLTLLYKFINVLVREEGKKVLFVTYNSTLIEDTKKRLKSCNEYIENKSKHSAHVMTFHEMATNILKQVKVIESGVGRLNVEKIKKYQGDALLRIAAILSKYTEKNSEIYKNLPNEEKLYSTHNMNFVTDEIAWIKAMGFVDLERYLSTERTGRSKSIRLTRNQRKTIFKVYQDYQHQLESFKYGEILDLEDYALRIVHNDYLLSDDIKYDYIFVDEVQDLDPMQIMALCRLTKKSIILSGDAKQRIYKKCPIKYEDLGLMVRQKGKRKILNKNYRSTAEIVTLANSLDFYDSEDKLSAKQFVKEGERPIIHITKDSAIAAKYIVDQIKKIYDEDPSKSVAIIHREEVKQKTGYKTQFRIKLEQLLLQSMSDINSYSYKFDYKKDKQIFYTNAYDVKGLEFDIVFIVDFNKSFYPHSDGIKKIKESNEGKDDNLIKEDVLEFINTEKKLLYVAMTRAKERLFLVANNCKSESQISEFIYDFESKDYKSSGFTKIEIEKAKQHYRFIGNGKLFRLKEKEIAAKIQEEIAKGMEKVADINLENNKTEIDKVEIKEKEIVSIISDDKVENINTNNEKKINEEPLTPKLPRKMENGEPIDLIDTVVKPILTKYKIKFVDDRNNKGSFWVIGGTELKAIMNAFSKQGLVFTYIKFGGKATGRKPSWYLK